MYLSQIEIYNYRNFSDCVIEFNDGLNVIIGENNAGKSNLLKALSLIFDRQKRARLNIDDFHKGITDFKSAPEIKITIILKGTEHDSPEDKAIVAAWLTKLDKPWEAQLIFRFFLPENQRSKYEKKIREKKEDGGNLDDLWKVVESFLPKYVSRIYGGNPASQNRADSDTLERFDYIFLDAIRDVESKMFTGKNPLLKEVLSYFLDYDIKKNPKLDDEIKESQIIQKETEFQGLAAPLLNQILNRVSLKPITDLAQETGANKGGNPKFEGRLAELDIIEALKLIIEKSGFKIPVTSNGLGYNNLIFIALILAKIQSEANEEIFADNAIVFPMLALEEPEAHLHPALQYKFLKFLNDKVKEQSFSRQIFVTTHSTNITSAVGLDKLICLSVDKHNSLRVVYPGKVFSDSGEDKASKNYIERYLDATKSNMLFSKGVIFVEGISELLLVRCFANYTSSFLEDSHVTVINVSGLNFKHFLKIFGGGINDDCKKYSLNKKVACIIDLDPAKKEKKPNAKWKACWPFELNLDQENFDYKSHSSTVDHLHKIKSENIKIFHSEYGKGKTFEYDLALENHHLGVLLTDNIKESDSVMLKNLISSLDNTFDTFIDSNEDEYIKSRLTVCSWSDPDKKRAKIAANYLECISKAENSFYIQYALNQSLEKGERNTINIPKHIEEAIVWACDNY